MSQDKNQLSVLEQKIEKSVIQIKKVIQSQNTYQISKNYMTIVKNLNKILIWLSCLCQKGESLTRETGLLDINVLQLLGCIFTLQHHPAYFSIWHIIRKSIKSMYNCIRRIKNYQFQISLEHKKILNVNLNQYGMEQLIYNEQIKQYSTTNQLLTKISKNQIIVQAPDCISCLRYFSQESLISLEKCPMPTFAITQTQGFDRITLQRYVCSVSNLGGGIIIIGAQKINNCMRICGMPYTSNQQYQQRYNEIIDLVKYIKPKLNIQISCLYQNQQYSQRMDGIANLNLPKYCFRLKVEPLHLNCMHYIQVNIKGWHTKYESYTFDKNEKPIKIYPEQNILQPLFYKLMTKKLKSCQNRIVLHRNIKCYAPFEAKFIQQSQNLSCFHKNTIQSSSSQQKIDDPKFKYSYTSLISVSSKTDQRFITDLVPHFQHKKINACISKPFADSFKAGSKCIWMVSHMDKFNIIRNIIKQKDKGGYVTIIPVFNTLQIQKSKFNEFNQKIIEQRFKNRFNNGYIIQWKQLIDTNGSVVHSADLIFRNYTESIYAYFLFQQIQLRPHFVQTNTTFKKTNKKH